MSASASTSTSAPACVCNSIDEGTCHHEAPVAPATHAHDCPVIEAESLPSSPVARRDGQLEFGAPPPPKRLAFTATITTTSTSTSRLDVLEDNPPVWHRASPLVPSRLPNLAAVVVAEPKPKRVVEFWDTQLNFRSRFHQAAKARDLRALDAIYMLVARRFYGGDSAGQDSEPARVLLQELARYDDMALLHHLMTGSYFSPSIFEFNTDLMELVIREGHFNSWAYFFQVRGGLVPADLRYLFAPLEKLVRTTLLDAAHHPLLLACYLRHLVPEVKKLVSSYASFAQEVVAIRSLVKDLLRDQQHLEEAALRQIAESGLLLLLGLDRLVTVKPHEPFVFVPGCLGIQLAHLGYPNVNVPLASCHGNSLAVHVLPSMTPADMTCLLDNGLDLTSHVPAAGEMNTFLVTLFRTGKRDLIATFLKHHRGLDLAHIVHGNRVLSIYESLLVFGDAALFVLALDCEPVSLQWKDPHAQETLLHVLARYPTIYKQLPRRTVTDLLFRLDIDAQDAKEHTALHRALLHDNVALAVDLVKHCANIGKARNPPEQPATRPDLSATVQQLVILTMGDLGNWLSSQQQETVLATLRDKSGFSFKTQFHPIAICFNENDGPARRLALRNQIFRHDFVREIRFLAQALVNGDGVTPQLLAQPGERFWSRLMENLKQLPSSQGPQAPPTTKDLCNAMEIFRQFLVADESTAFEF